MSGEIWERLFYLGKEKKKAETEGYLTGLEYEDLGDKKYKHTAVLGGMDRGVITKAVYNVIVKPAWLYSISRKGRAGC